METTYYIDDRDLIVRVSNSWDRFARENQGEGASAAAVLGRSLWEFITGETTRNWLRTLLNLSRLNKMPVDRPYRCDSPSEKRFMSMRIIPQTDGLVAVSHTILYAHKVSPAIDFEFTPSSNLAQHTRCSICNRLQTDGEWAEATKLVDEGRLQVDRTVLVIYEVCDDCRELLPRRTSPV